VTPSPRRRLPGEVLLAGAMLAALAVLGALVAWTAGVPRLDDHVRGWVLAHQAGPLRDVLSGVTHLGDAGLVIPLFLALAGYLSWFRRTAEPLVLALSGSGLLALSVGVGKALLGRQGPSREPAAFLSGAWPSGHTATATVVYLLLACLLTQQFPEHRAGYGRYAVPALLGLPGLVAAALVYCDYHWLSDVVGGLLLGVPVAIATQLLTRRLLRSRRFVLPPARPTASQNRS
jgi:membrane-associated phospholipid phosphatase